MRFANDSQRKAVMAKINKFTAAPIGSYTHSDIYVDEGGVKQLVPVRTETVIIPGADYKRGIREKWAKERGGVDYQHVQLGDDENRELVARMAGAERFVGMPVYSVPAQKEYIPGGYADGKPDEDFDREQIIKGANVELEHVVKYTDKGNKRKPKDTDLDRAKEIAKDHLAEIPDYYDRLEQLEEGAKADGVFVDVDAAKQANEFAEKPKATVFQTPTATGFVKDDMVEYMREHPLQHVPKDPETMRKLKMAMDSGIG